MMKTQSNFQFPEDLDPKFLDETVRMTLDQVHDEFFNDKSELTHPERRVFIELSYCAIIELLCTHYQPKTLNISCKSTVDRGAAQLAVQHAYHFRQNKELIDKKLISILTLAPALATQNRAMLANRFNLMHQTLRKLLE
jgi:hypothetical protein